MDVRQDLPVSNVMYPSKGIMDLLKNPLSTSKFLASRKEMWYFKWFCEFIHCIEYQISTVFCLSMNKVHELNLFYFLREVYELNITTTINDNKYHTSTWEKWRATIGMQATPIKMMQKPNSRPSAGGLPYHHWRDSKMASRQNQTAKATTKECIYPCWGFIFEAVFDLSLQDTKWQFID